MNPYVENTMYVLILIMSVALVVACYRLMRGPSICDRIMALDLIAITIVAITALCAIAFGVTVLLDIAIVIALIGFVGTVAFSVFIQKRAVK